MRANLLLFFVLAVAARGRSESPDGIFRHLSTGQGLSDGHVREIVQDQRGFLWFATVDGLNRYNGYEVRVFRHVPENARSLGASFVRALHVDREGRLWVGTMGGGLNLFDPRSEDFTRFVHDPSEPFSLASNEVRFIRQARTGELWIATSNGVDRMDPETGRFRHYRHDPDDPGSLSHDDVYELLEDGTGTLWVATYGGGLDRLNPGRDDFVHYRHDPKDGETLSSDLVNALWVDKSGALWIGTWGGGVSRLDPEQGTFTRFSDAALGSENIWTIRGDSEGALWVGTWGYGLSRIAPDRQSVETYVHDSSKPSSLGHDNVISVFEDREGLLWVGTGGGVSVLDLYRKPFKVHSLDLAGGARGRGSEVRAIHEDPAGTLWIGTLGEGLFAMEPETGLLRSYRSRTQDPSSLASDGVSSIVADGRGVLWVGTSKGLDELDLSTFRFRHHKSVPSDPRTLSDDAIHSLLLEPGGGRLWVGTARGLDELDPATGIVTRKALTVTGGDHHDGIFILLRDRRGVLWFSRFSGLESFDPVTGRSRRHVLSSGSSWGDVLVFTAREDETGRIWLGSGIGLLALDPATGIVKRFEDGEGPRGAVYSLEEDRRGRLWLAAAQGLYRFDKGGEFRRYGPEEIGLRQGLTFGSSVSRTGRLYFCTADGFVTFDPMAIEDNRTPPPVVLTGLQLSNQDVAIGNESTLTQSITETKRIEISPRDRVFSIEFASLSYRAPWKNRYRYRLEGFDDEWTEVTSDRRLATYTHLPPGDYMFQVAGSNDDGLWSAEAVSLAIAVLPSWWQTWWFRLGSLAGAGLLTFGVHRLRMRALTTRARELGKEIDARKKIESALREREEMNRGVLESLESAIALLDSDGRLSAVNEKWKRLFPGNVVGSNFLEVLDNEELVAGIESVLRGGRGLSEAEVPGRTAPGERRYSVSIVPFLGSTGGAVIAFNDIEARKRAEEEASRHREELAHVSRISTMGELVASIAHEINQPLASIVTNANAGRRFLDRDDPGSDEVRGVLVAISEQGQRASDILRGLRKLAKKGTVEQKELDVNELIRDVSRLTQRAAVGGRVSMRLSLTETLPRLVGDPIQLEQVFLNLVVNAIDAMSQDETGPRDLTIRTWSEEKSSVEIAVADSAPPVSKEILERMFERFYTTKATGLGIGLSTSRSIIEAHGGRLWAEPNPARGLTLRVRLPAAPDGS